MNNVKSIEYLKVQGIVGEQSFSIVLQKKYAIELGIEKGDFVKVHQKEGCIVIEKAFS
jgi:formylmethanofuran dehydrogenase subunit D